MSEARTVTADGWRARLSSPWTLWGAWSSLWGFASFVCVRLAVGRPLEFGEILIGVPLCYALGVLMAHVVSRVARVASRRDSDVG